MTPSTWRSHQVPCSDVRDNPDRLKLLESWLKSYRPEELFDASGALTQVRLLREQIAMLERIRGVLRSGGASRPRVVAAR
jgi:phosphoketolase